MVVKLILPKPIVIGCAYLPPSPSSLMISSLFKHLSNLHVSPLILLGDFNLPDVNWSSLTSSTPSSGLFCDLSLDLNLLQLVNCPTHSGGNTLDLILADCPDTVTDICADSAMSSDLSDHDVVWFSVQISRFEVKHKTRSFFQYSKADCDGIQDHLASLVLPPIIGSNTDLFWGFFKTALHETRDLFVPMVSLPAKPSPVWYTSEIRYSIHKVRYQRRVVQCNSTPYQLSKLRKLEAPLRAHMEFAKEAYCVNLCNRFKDDPRALYSHLSCLTNSSCMPQTVHLGPTTATTNFDKANLFNAFFNSTFAKSNFNLPPVSSLPAPSSQLSYIDISAYDVSKKLSNLNIYKSCGVDKLHPLLLKLCAGPLLVPITSFLQTCLMYHTIPREWKCHSICPIPKKGDLSEVSNYRPISLLCIMSKILESIVFDKIISFIRPKLSVCQFGFLKQRSCLLQLLSSYSIVFEAVENMKLVDTIFFDFRKAFDSVPHQELLYKLWLIGITGPLWEWFREYLAGRSHCTTINGVSSSYLPVLSGVPQGSVLGPLLFLIYINDIPEKISSDVFLFADDMKFLRTIYSHSDYISVQSDIDSLTEWSNEWKLHLNVNKCCHMSFSLLHEIEEGLTYHVDGVSLNNVDSYRDLGIIVTNNLSWSKHYQSLCGKAYRALQFIRRNIPFSSSVSVKRTLYISLVRSQFNFCSQLWSPAYIKDIRMLETVQRRATKFIVSHSMSYRERLIELQLFPLMYYLDLQDVLFLLKCIKYPPDNFNVFSYISFCKSNTRSSSMGKLMYVYKRLSTTRHFYFNRVVRIWNQLPFLDLTLSFNSLKSIVVDHLWNHFVCNFNSFNVCSYHFICPCNNCHLKSSF